MKYNYNIKIKSDFPPQVLLDKLKKIVDTFTIIESVEQLEEVEDETPPDKTIIKEIPLLYV